MHALTLSGTVSAALFVMFHIGVLVYLSCITSQAMVGPLNPLGIPLSSHLLISIGQFTEVKSCSYVPCRPLHWSDLKHAIGSVYSTLFHCDDAHLSTLF